LTNGTLAAREHYWDTLRAFVMLLGIPYHVALSYRIGDTWIVSAGPGLPGMATLAEFLHLFRMPTFFVIAGYFAAMLLARRAPGTWLRGRFTRLGIPFLTTIATLVPLMNLACEFSALPFDDALRSFRDNSLSSGGYWVRHLWFIIVLLYCCVLAAALVRWRPALAQRRLSPRKDGVLARRFTPALLLVAAAIGLWEGAVVEAFYDRGFATELYQQVLRTEELIIYLPWFALGCILQRSPLVQARFGEPNCAAAIIAVSATILCLTIREQLHPAAGRFIEAFAALGITQSLVAAARTWFDRPSPLARKVTDAAFVIYLFHMPIIVWLAFLAQDLAVPVALKVGGTMALTLALSWAAWLLIRRSSRWSLRFNGAHAPARLSRAGA